MTQDMGGNHPTLGNGKICYIEIPCIDRERSASFYEKVFGWQIRKRDNGEITFTDAVGEVSGRWAMNRKTAGGPGLFISIMVDSLAATIDSIIANGGKIVQPVGENAPDRTAQFSDPAGNIIGLYQQR